MLLTELEQFKPFKAFTATELEISHSIIDIVFYRFYEQIIIDLSELGLCQYDGGEVTRDKAKSVLTTIATTGNVFEIQRHWAQSYTVVLLHYNRFKDYVHRYLAAHPDQTKVIARNGWIYYKDSRGYKQKFV